MRNDVQEIQDAMKATLAPFVGTRLKVGVFDMERDVRATLDKLLQKGLIAASPLNYKLEVLVDEPSKEDRLHRRLGITVNLNV